MAFSIIILLLGVNSLGESTVGVPIPTVVFKIFSTFCAVIPFDVSAV